MPSLPACTKLLAACLCWLWMAGCADDAKTDVTHACEPLARRDTPVELGDIVAVGRAPDATLIVVDRGGDPSLLRLFVSEGMVLVRHEVAGSGESNAADGTQLISLSSDDLDPPIAVFIERAAGKLRMKVYRGADASGSKSPDFASSPGDEIDVVDSAQTQSYTLRNVPGEITVEYFARAGADRLVATRPTHDFTYDAVRLFFGPPAGLVERAITKFQRARDGGTTTIDFVLDGAKASVLFTNRLQPDGPTITEPVTLEVDGKEREIMRVLPAEDPELESLRFQCTTD